MALTVTEKFRWTAGGKAFRMVDIVHDGSVASVTASDLDLDYIMGIVAHCVNISMQANTSVPLQLNTVSINASNTGVVWAAVDENAISHLTVVGW